MKIILTHEQADFDALASLLGVYLLDETVIPVLPRRMNRNVKAFITLYGVELPFIDPRDLPNEGIDSMILVDTQSMVSVKGVGKKTSVHVIDHHPKRENLPSDWKFTISETGATTTILVEMFRGTNEEISPIQATLLLLGIYEDTGSLTYSRTSSRDLQAAAYLLDAGGNLQIANNFLNHPLTKAQQEVYDRLRQNSQTLHIQGHNIVISIGDAEQMEEELSTIAHKLRDLLDPDAIFVLVKTRSGVQLIARSTNDLIDVAEIVGFFGGGGHERAAAGLIRDREVESLFNELVDLLPKLIRPAISVTQIMSRHPRLLTPETLIETADELMRRYGYEGYPIVEMIEEGNIKKPQIVGLLTRRGVDRAISHKLHLPVSKVMEPGQVFIHPDESIESLQRLMTDTGWGQIPVLDEVSGNIIGIVTRTDLLKTLTPQPHVPDRIQITSKLESVLPSKYLDLLKEIAITAHEQLAALYIVGGFVRDLIMEKPSLDFDLVVEGDAIQLAYILAQKWGGRVTSHNQFGTAKWHLEGSRFEFRNNNYQLTSIDLVGARIEYYQYPTALPTVERGSIKNDLHRRDFTINTLALRFDGRHYGEIHDYYGGLNDLKLSQVRVLHSLSFIDDPTRILRAVRFEKRFNFVIESHTLKQLIENKFLLEKLSGDRIRHELDHILNEPNVTLILSRLNELGLLKIINQSIPWNTWLEDKISHLDKFPPPGEWSLNSNIDPFTFQRNFCYCIWFARNTEEECKIIIKRLRMQSLLATSVLSTCLLWHKLPVMKNAKPSEIVNFLEKSSELARYTVHTVLDDEVLKQLLMKYNQVWSKIYPFTNGTYLRAQKIAPGPHYRLILLKLRNAWLDGEISTQDEELDYLHSLIDELPYLVH